MSINDTAVRFGRAVHDEIVQARADQMELGQQLTERINGVADRVKVLDKKVTVIDERLDALQASQTALQVTQDAMQASQAAMQATQKEMMGILIDIQRKLANCPCN